jgi:hypothetical protein
MEKNKPLNSIVHPANLNRIKKRIKLNEYYKLMENINNDENIKIAVQEVMRRRSENNIDNN